MEIFPGPNADDVTCTFLNTRPTINLTIVKETVGGDDTFDFSTTSESDVQVDDFSLTTVSGTAQKEFTGVPLANYVFKEDAPAGWQFSGASCTGATYLSDTNSGTLEIFPGPNADDVTCTFLNEKMTSPDGYCPVDPNVGNLRTDLLGIGQGSPSTAYQTRTLNIPNYAQVSSLYGQLASVDVGIMKYVRFRYPNNTYVQIGAPTSPAYRSSAVNWWGAELTPNRYVRGQFFWTASAKKSPRAFVLWPTYRTDEPYANVFARFDNSSTNHVYWDVANGWTSAQVQTISIPETQIDGADIVVKIALVDNNKDARPVVLTVSAGGVSKQIVKSVPNKKDTLNLEEILLEDVPAGTDEVVIELLSPGPNNTTFGTGNLGGDSVAMIGAAVNYTCDQP